MRILTAGEMRATDTAAVERFGVSRGALMENAGAAVARFALAHWPAARRIVVLCGRGNNGGDGAVAARHLRSAGKSVSVILLGEPAQLKGEAAENLARWKTAAIKLRAPEDLAHPQVLRKLTAADLFIDAVYGTGFHPPLDALAAAVKAALDKFAATPVLAVDLPSGWDADARASRNADAFRADAVVTFTAPKIAHAWGDLTRGPIVVADIRSPDAALAGKGKLHWAGSALMNFQTRRARDANKGSFGHVLMVGGSRGKSGAPAMAALAAMRAGAGLTTAAVPASVLGTVAAVAPELMTYALEEDDGGAAIAANADQPELARLLEKASVVALGPGLGQAEVTRQFVHSVVANTQQPMVLDADGLNAFAGQAEKLRGGKRVLALTPHPGEMARLLGTTVKAVEADRERIAREFATAHELILVLKGWRTLIAHPDGRVAVNTSGNAGMAKGGSGDVLTGLIAGLLAQAESYSAAVGEAVEAAVYLHGLAADMAVAAGDEHTFLPTDLLRWLPQAFQHRAQDGGICPLQDVFSPGDSA